MKNWSDLQRPDLKHADKLMQAGWKMVFWSGDVALNNTTPERPPKNEVIYHKGEARLYLFMTGWRIRQFDDQPFENELQVFLDEILKN